MIRAKFGQAADEDETYPPLAGLRWRTCGARLAAASSIGGGGDDGGFGSCPVAPKCKEKRKSQSESSDKCGKVT